jgi:hypothetical protein
VRNADIAWLGSSSPLPVPETRFSSSDLFNPAVQARKKTVKGCLVDVAKNFMVSHHMYHFSCREQLAMLALAKMVLLQIQLHAAAPTFAFFYPSGFLESE